MRHSYRFALVLIAAVTLAAPRFQAAADDGKQDNSQKSATQKPEAETPIPAESHVSTEHTLELNGKTIDYTATAGTLLVRDEKGKPDGSFFYVAYTKDGVTDPKTRPVTFLYNGGPGSASIWLHMGSVGPVRVVTDSPQATGPAPYQIVDNQYSLLDVSDLVFIDAMGAGYSRPVGEGKEKDFTGTDQDVHAFALFITRYLTVNQRWNSPKFLMGESYGTTRSAALADALQGDGISCNGVILVSSILNYSIEMDGTDEPFIANLPSYAAIAYYHDKLAQKPANLDTFLDDARAFARGPYAAALAQGDKLSPQEEDAVAAKMSAFTGLSVQYLKQANLRVEPGRFRKELMRDDREILGRYDARFEGTDVDAAGEGPGYDPSESGITGAFTAAFHDYLTRVLKYDTQSQEPYYLFGPHVYELWDWKHHPPTGGVEQLPYVAGDLADAMRKNPKLKVFSANGLFDLATPFFATEFDLSHMNLDPALRGNVKFGYYPSGHMIYLNVKALAELKKDLANFYASALQ